MAQTSLPLYLQTFPYCACDRSVSASPYRVNPTISSPAPNTYCFTFAVDTLCSGPCCTQALKKIEIDVSKYLSCSRSSLLFHQAIRPLTRTLPPQHPPWECAPTPCFPLLSVSPAYLLLLLLLCLQMPSAA